MFGSYLNLTLTEMSGEMILRHKFIKELSISLLILFIFPVLNVSAVDNNKSTIAFTAEEQKFIEENPVIIVGGEMDWPPYDFVENGEYTGAAKDYLTVLEKYTGLRFDVKTGFTWDELLSRLKNKQFDMLPMIYWNKQRTEFVNFTDPYLVIRQYLFVHKDTEDIASIENLYNKTLAIPKGYAQIKILNEIHPEINILEVEGTLAAIDAVVTKRAEGLIESTALISYLSKKNNIQGLKPVFATSIGINNIHMGIRKDRPILRDILQKGLNAMTHAERVDIAQKWLAYGTAGVDSSVKDKGVTFSKQEQQYLLAKKTIKACVNPDWMPVEGIKDGEYVGIGADYLSLFQKQLPIPVDIVPSNTWVESMSLAKARTCDMFILGTDIEKQTEFMELTSEFLKLPVVIATKQDVLFISNLSDLNNKSIGVVDGYALKDVINKNAPSINFVSVSSRDEGLKMVTEGKLFAYMDTVSSIDYEIIRNYYGELKIGGKFDIDWELGVATRNDEPLLAQIFDKIILQIPRQTKQKILNQWVSTEYVQGFNYDLFRKIVGVFILVIFIIILRNRQLVRHKQEIHQKNIQLENINTQLEIQRNEIQHLADHDFLTKLPNKKTFLAQLEHAISIASRQENSLAVLFLDLDRFKNINDTLGHDVGDELLKAISYRLKDVLRESDTVARIGGDEFLVMLEAVDDVAYPSIVAEKLVDSVKQPIKLSNHTLSVSVSVGIALFPEHGRTSDVLIKNADTAMYLTKERGKNHYQYYSQELSEKISRRHIIEQSFKDAMLNKELSLHYQPQIDLKHESIVGAEVLLRWQHPELGVISPFEFIPIAEESGHIIELGEWVFRNACQEFVSWRQQGYQLDNLAINVSSVQFSQGNLPDLFKEIIDQYSLPAHHIEIEITERYIMDHTDKKMHVLNALRDLGFRISVDDFGTGYSSMAYLKTLPLDIIKIDKSFISDIPQDKNDIHIAKAILALSHSLGYEVVAEGIETKEQLDMLVEMSCDIGQGYYFSKPVPADKFLELYSKYSNESTMRQASLNFSVGK